MKRGAPRDPEERAVRLLGHRIQRAKAIGVGVLAFGAIASGAAAYVLLRSVFFEEWGVHSPWITGCITFGGALAFFASLAWLLKRTWLRRAAQRWASELAAEHGIGDERLRDVFMLLT